MERLERKVLSERQVVMTALAAGEKDAPMPTLDGALQDLDEALAAEPAAEPVDTERDVMLAAIGAS